MYIIAWLYHFVLSEALGEKVEWKLACNVQLWKKKILEAAHHKTIAARPLDSHLTNYPCKMEKSYWALPEKQIRTHNWYSSMDYDTWIYQSWPIRKTCNISSCIGPNL